MERNSKMKKTMKKVRKILFVTEGRTAYSRFKPILERIKHDPILDYYLIVTGAHLSHSRELIKKDGFKIAAEVEMFSKKQGDKGVDMAESFGRVIRGLSREIERLRPDLIFTAFDISANLAAAIIGGFMNIPVAHLEGGEVSGTIDESIRHAITKFAQIHFPYNEEAKKRIIKLGEKPENIFVVGCPSLGLISDILKKPKLLLQKELAKEFKINFSKPYIVILQHPVTTEEKEARKQMITTLKAVKEIGIQTILIYPNIDAGSQRIIREIEKTKIERYKSLAFEKFIKILSLSSVLVGNSSAGIHEAASLHIPVVNIGTRQQGRLRPKNIIDVDYNKEEIKKAIKKALNDEKFKKIVKKSKNPYDPFEDGKSAERIVKILKKIDIGEHMVQKKITY